MVKATVSMGKLYDQIFYQFVTWFSAANEMTELDSGMPAPQFGEESLLSSRIGAGSGFKRFHKRSSRTTG
jgi:hypothetical protein